MNGTLVANGATALKKSELQSLDLPPAEVKMDGAGLGCQLGADSAGLLHGYYFLVLGEGLTWTR